MNLVDYLDRGALLDPGRACFVLRDGSVQITHGEMQALSHRIAARLISAELGPGTRIGVYSPNDLFAFACILGILRAGATWVTMNVRSPPSELRDVLETVECEALFRHPSVASEAEEILNGLPQLSAVVGMEDLESWMAPPGTRVSRPPLDPEATAVLAATGGTTGKPKGVPVTHRQFVLMSLAFNAHMPEAPPPVYIMATPMTHAAGGVAFPVLAVGGTVVVHEGVVPIDIFESIERHRATQIFLPPTAIYALMADPGVHDCDFSSLRHFLVSAAPMAAERLAEAVDVFGPVMTQVYGQTESPFICTFFGPDEIAQAAADPSLRTRLGSCGRPSLVAAVEIIDDRGRPVDVGEPGEIVVRGGLVMNGYYNDASATQETRRPDGWHGTGDVGYRDRDGYIYIVDRKKDMIITGGFNVFSSEVEQVLHGFDAVNDCAVIGLPDEKWGEAVTAVIEPKPGREIDELAIVAACRERLGPVKTPKQIIVRQLPRSSVGKVLKRELREEYWAGRDLRV